VSAAVITLSGGALGLSGVLLVITHKLGALTRTVEEAGKR